MNTEAGIWLLALLIAAAFSAVRLRLQGLNGRWGRGWYGHLAVVALLGGLGLLVADAWKELAQLLAALGWLLLLLPGFGLMAALRRLHVAVAAYDLAGARRHLAWLRPFAHLPGAALARAQVGALERVLAGDHAGAEALLDPYDAADAPPPLRKAAQGVRLFVRLHARDWAGILAQAEAMAPQGPASPTLAGPAVRAALELGDLAAATRWLGRLEVSDVADAPAVDQVAVPAFALLGATADLEGAFARLGEETMPARFRAFWRGRALAANGDVAGARAVLAAALADLPDDLAEARLRVGHALAALDDAPPPLPDAARARVLEAARAAIAPARGAADLVGGGRDVLVPRLLAGLVAVPSLLVFAAQARWLPPALEGPVLAAAARGVLHAPAVKAGAWWQLLTHMGLHAHLTHLALNLFALLWLGSRAARLFGPVALVGAFLAGGVAGGLVHVAFSPAHDAVGASGGILALLGMVAVGWWRAGDLLPAPLRQRLLWEMAAVIGIQLVFDQFAPQVAAAAHAGGLVAGALLGAVVPLRGRAEG